MSLKKRNPIKKEILLPSFIGDWTTFKPRETAGSVSISKSLTGSHKTISEADYNQLLFLHHQFIEIFFEKLSDVLNTHIEIERISIELNTHEIFKQTLEEDIYQCKYNLPELDQIDLILDTLTTRFICHRLCGGTTPPTDISPLSEVEISLISIINELFINNLSDQWKTIFTGSTNNIEAHYGDYIINPQQSEIESLVEITTRFKLFNQSGLSLKLLYSLDTIEKLLSLFSKTNHSIKDNISLSKTTLKKTFVNAISSIGKTNLAITEIQSLEIGDVIVLDNHSVNDPIRLTIGDSLLFNVLPVTVNENKIGVQIIDTPQYETYLKEKSLPESGPFISAAPESNTNTNNNIINSQDPTDHSEPTNEINTDSEDSIESTLPIESEPPIIDEDLLTNDSTPEIIDDNSSIQDPETILDEPELSSEMNEVDNEDTTDNDNEDFSWDDFDD